MKITEIRAKSLDELKKTAKDHNIPNYEDLNKYELIMSVLKKEHENEEGIFKQGVLEILPDGFGFLRSNQSNYISGPDDIYISP